MANHPGVHAALDLSDGLQSDLTKLCAASGCGAVVDVEKIPLSAQLRARYGKNAHELAITGGEDYELLCTVAPGDVPDFLHVIGKITQKQAITFVKGNHVHQPTRKTFEHF